MEACVIFNAVLTRLLFAAFGVLCIWRVYNIRGTATTWLLMLAEAGLFVETLFTLIARKGKEWKWFSPCVLFYLCCTIPSIWFLEMDELKRRLADGSEKEEACRNMTGNVTEEEMEGSVNLQSFGIDAEITIENWVGALEQIMVMLLVIGRWLLPRGDLTRDELSQLLLAYIAMAADIVELFQVFEEERVGNKSRVVYAALALYTWSLLQFTIVLTAARARKSRPGAIRTAEGTLPKSTLGPDGQKQPSEEDKGDKTRRHRGTMQEVEARNLSLCGCCHPDVFAMVTTIVMQDGPFLGFRLYLIFYERVLTQGVLFFVGKNTLLIVLQIYRIVIICTGKEETNDPAMERELDEVATNDGI
ncbi:transmembrane protein 26-like [Branchiostoma floridae]|uniref:Transmembrane protein 26-like n=1 Tax=Branchiostoma floridae TaxID=7739 RepID=A0A9J7M941_BRAFL|nr:transmembrane protein 26-like [Branchiostoma floridae]